MPKYACQNCGHPYEAFPPDDLYTVAVIGVCVVQSAYGNVCCVPIQYECADCNHRSKLWWHNKDGHTRYEISQAETRLEMLSSERAENQ